MEAMKKDTHRQEFCKKLDIFVHTFLMSLDLPSLTLLDTPLEHSSAHPRDDIEAAPRLLLLLKAARNYLLEGKNTLRRKKDVSACRKTSTSFLVEVEPNSLILKLINKNYFWSIHKFPTR